MAYICQGDLGAVEDPGPRRDDHQEEGLRLEGRRHGEAEHEVSEEGARHGGQEHGGQRGQRPAPEQNGG